MHAYLIVGQNSVEIDKNIERLCSKLEVGPLIFPFAKIEDARALSSFTKFSVSSPTAIILYSIEAVTQEAANAFLKNLEEGQENLYYILTTANINQVLPTIVSRCQVIKVHSAKCIVQSEHTEEFLQNTIGEQFAIIDGVKDREGAEEFVAGLISTFHNKLLTEDGNYRKITNAAEVAQMTFERLKANGNVQLQLTNMVIRLN